MSLDISLIKTQPTEVFSQNITHNLTAMAEEAGMYKHIWRPDEAGIKTAQELVKPLRLMIEQMEDDPERFRKRESENGWGTYEDFLPWLREYRQACLDFPDATIEADR